MVAAYEREYEALAEKIRNHPVDDEAWAREQERRRGIEGWRAGLRGLGT
jgi:hypothetical protein